MFLVVVDAHSRWLERMTSTTSEKTIEVLQKLFARYGIPAQLVSDNGRNLHQKSFSNSLRETESNTSRQHRTTLLPTGWRNAVWGASKVR